MSYVPWCQRLLSFLALSLFLSLPLQVRAQDFVTIATGGVTGVYYPAGGAICRLVNEGRRNHGVRCTVESTGGSLYNLKTLKSGAIELGIVQSDWHAHAWNGTSVFADDGKWTQMRSVFSIHPEPFTVVARKDSGIETFEDLKGKRVNIGNPGSGHRATMQLVMSAYGWEESDFSEVHQLTSSEQAGALCDNKFDAMVINVGHPSGSIKEATTSCSGVLVQVTGPVIDELVDGSSEYSKVEIAGGLYQGNPDAVMTFGTGATVVTHENVPEHVIYAVTKTVFENIDTFRRLHPAFVGLTKKLMMKNGLTAPLHPGAEKYYREAGLLRE